MTKPALRQCTIVVVSLICLISPIFAQQSVKFNQNTFPGNHPGSAPQAGLVFRVNGDRIKSSSDSIAAAASFMPSLSAYYYTGGWGAGMEYGGFSNSPHFDIEEYSSRIRSFTTNTISSTQWKTTYLLAGPSYRKAFGIAPFAVSADLLGGLMKMKAPSFSIKDINSGGPVADYYYDSKTSTASGNALFAFKPAVRLEWFPGRGPVGINVHAAYLQAVGAQEITTYYRDLTKVNFNGVSQDEIRSQVLQAPVIETKTKGPVSSFSFGGGITIQLNHEVKSPRDAASGLATGRRVSSGREAGSGLATGRRRTPVAGDNAGMAIDEAGSRRPPVSKMAITENGLPGPKPKPQPRLEVQGPRDAASGMATGKRMMTTENNAGADAADNSSCGPVSKTITNSDGTTEQMVFSCPKDAAMYENINNGTPARMSTNMTLGKQTQGATFGEKVNAGRSENIIQKDLAARNIISGKLSWGAGSGITTNKSNGHGSMGTRVVFAAREAGSGMATGRRNSGGRDAASGQATGRRQYNPLVIGHEHYQSVFSDGEDAKRKNEMPGAPSNPMYSSSGGVNPLFEASSAVVVNPLYSSSGNSGSNPMYNGLATAGPGDDRDSDNDGISDIYVSLIDASTGEMVSNTKSERSGDFYFANVPDGRYKVNISCYYFSKKGYDVHLSSPADIAGAVQVNEEMVQLELSTQKQDSLQTPEGIATSRSNARTKTVNTSRDNIKHSYKTIRTYFDNGDTPTQEQARPGQPIGGIIVKGGKNPGGSLRTISTDENGEFEYTGLEAGNYLIILEYQVVLEDETVITVGE